MLPVYIPSSPCACFCILIPSVPHLPQPCTRQGAGRIIFVDVSSSKYRPSKNMGISQDEAMTTIHAIRPDGLVLMVGVEMYVAR